MEGMIFTADQAARQLRDANRDYEGRKTWENAYAGVELSRQQGLSTLGRQYGNEINNAFISAQQQANAINASNLGQGFKSIALEQNEATLNQAFESYKANYLANVSQVNQTAQTATSEIDSLLNTQAKNMADYGNAHYEYLTWLYENNLDVFTTDPNFAKYIKDGNLMSTEELSAGLFDIDPVTGTGPLNARGVDFFKQIENAGLTLGAGNSFADYLLSSNRGRELYDWATAADPYNLGGRNVDTWQQMTGTEGPYEVGTDSFTDEQWTNVTKKHTDQIAAWETMLDDDGGKRKNAETFVTEMFGSTDDDGNVTTGSLQELKDTIESLSLTDEVGSMLDGGWDGFNKRMEDYKARINDPSGKGTNKENRAYAINEAIREYQKLYNAMSKALDKTELELRSQQDDPWTRGNYYETTYTAKDGTQIKVSSPEEAEVYRIYENYIVPAGEKVQKSFFDVMEKLRNR